MNRFGQLSRCVTLHADPIVDSLRYLGVEIEATHKTVRIKAWPSLGTMPKKVFLRFISRLGAEIRIRHD